MNNEAIKNKTNISNVYEFRGALKTLYMKYREELSNWINTSFNGMNEIEKFEFYPDSLSIYIVLKAPAFTYNPDVYSMQLKSIIQSFVLKHRLEVALQQEKQPLFDEFIVMSNLIFDRVVLGKTINFML